MADEKNWEVYIIESEAGTLYTGISTDIERRFQEHKSGTGKGARYFHMTSPRRIVFREKHANRSEASRREREIKKMTRAMKQELIRANRKKRRSAT